MKECKIIDDNYSSVELEELLNNLYGERWVVSKIKKTIDIHYGYDQQRNRRHNYFILLEREVKQ